MFGKQKTKKKRSRLRWYEKLMIALFGVVVLGGAVFSIMWFVPSIHDAVWTPETTTETPDNTEQDTNTDDTEQGSDTDNEQVEE